MANTDPSFVSFKHTLFVQERAIPVLWSKPAFVSYQACTSLTLSV